MEKQQIKPENERGEMLKNPDQLIVTYENRTVGRIGLNQHNFAVFEYDEEWLSDGFSISPFHLPLKPGIFVAKSEPFSRNFGVFNDSLPDSWGRLLLDLYLKELGYNPKSLSILERLSLVGNSAMGALCYHPTTETGEQNHNSDLETLSQQAQKILSFQDSEFVEELFFRGGASGGARPKVLIQYKNEAWLVKFPSKFDPPNISLLEYEYSLLAEKCSLQMETTRLFNKCFFGVKRFDRNGEKRFHVISASGLLNASHEYPSIDYIDLINATTHLTGSLSQSLKVFNLMIFNVLIGNKDDHAKNFSFIYSNGKWEFSPVYDIVPSIGFNDNHSTTINGKGNPAKQDIFEVAIKTGISRKLAELQYSNIHKTITENKSEFISAPLLQ